MVLGCIDPSTSDPFKSNVGPPFAVMYGSSFSAPPVHEKQFALFFFPEGSPKCADGLSLATFGPCNFPADESTSGPDKPIFIPASGESISAKLAFTASTGCVVETSTFPSTSTTGFEPRMSNSGSKLPAEMSRPGPASSKFRPEKPLLGPRISTLAPHKSVSNSSTSRPRLGTLIFGSTASIPGSGARASISPGCNDPSRLFLSQSSFAFPFAVI